MESPVDPDKLDEGRSLLRAAFQAARRTGKTDWRRMTVAVLKNRLLAASGGTFNEHDYGARSIREFVALYPEVVAPDFQQPYPVITLLETGDTEVEPPSSGAKPGRRRLRSDLWRAVFDYRSGERFGWDGTTDAVVPLAEREPGLALPTLTEAELDGWRREFAERWTGRLSDAEQAELERWLLLRLPTAMLPARLRSSWNGELSERAIRRLEAWFEAQRLTPPADLAVTAAPVGEPEQVARLRRFVQACVARMTADELERLELPARVAARVALPDDDQRPR